MVVGAEQKFVAALIVPSFSTLKEWLKDRHVVSSTNEDIIEDSLVIEHFENIIYTYNAHFNKVEQVKKFVLLPQEWGIESGELTPKLSLKRKVIMEKHKDEIDGIYNE